LPALLKEQFVRHRSGGRLQGSRVIGLTTAGGLWVTAGIGMAVGFGFYSLATIATVLVLFVLVAVNIFEKPIIKISEDIDKKN
jgi:putative Mg2+ transporter-C (MgtC) family protein